MLKPKVVVFDLGRVLLDFDYRKLEKKLAEHSNLPADEIARLFQQASLLGRYERGFLTSAQFFAEFKTATGYRGSLAGFQEMFADIFTPIPAMIGLPAAIRAQGVPVFIFSNTNELAATHVRDRYPFFNHFDGYVLSYEHGAMKPDDSLYQVVEDATGHRGQEVLYLDDMAENIETGARRGWQVIQHKTPEATIEALKSAGLLRQIQ